MRIGTVYGQCNMSLGSIQPIPVRIYSYLSELYTAHFWAVAVVGNPKAIPARQCIGFRPPKQTPAQQVAPCRAHKATPTHQYMPFGIPKGAYWCQYIAFGSLKALPTHHYAPLRPSINTKTLLKPLYHA